MTSLSDDILSDARILWDYHVIPSEPVRSDLILGLGSSDVRVAAAAADLAVRNVAPLIVMSGGLGKVTQATGGPTEAERFAAEAERLGVPRERILLEMSATNTGANFVNTRALLLSRGINVREAIFVTKPYMKRRASATATAQWPDVLWHPYSPDISFSDYPDSTISARQMIELMVGDLQRLDVYARKGLQVPQVVPESVWAAYKRLVDRGFDRYVIQE
jgi:uncharacterized SAM-binding protein YcdF (DUF218 family)